MKRIKLLLIGLIITAFSFAQGYTVNTTVTTTYGIDMPTGVQVWFIPHIGWNTVVNGTVIPDTSVTFELRFYANIATVGDQSINVLVNGNPLYFYEKEYTLQEFATLSTEGMKNDVLDFLNISFEGNVTEN
ncbi:MAG: hypothetical protein QNK20_16785 [Aureibaculum sp.]|nr:hypothetical protein [Aureibaculum sp.]